MECELVLQGRRLGAGDVAWLRQWVEEHLEWSRKRLAKELCRHWQWVDGRGRLKDFAARSLLLKLEARGDVALPPLRLNQRRVRPAVEPLPCWLEPSPWTAVLTEISPVRVQRIQAGTPEAKRWAYYLDRYHYLGLRVVGENLGYGASDRYHRDVGCVLFGAAAWRCAARDRHLGWSSEPRSRELGRVANNTRFLVLPKVPSYYSTSSVLSCRGNSGCCWSTDGTAKPAWTLATAA